MPRMTGLVFLLALSVAGCGWFGPAIPDATAQQVEHLGLALDAPGTWTRKDEPDLNRSLFFLEGTDRDHAVLVQRLPKQRSWRDHADRFREMQDQVLDKIQGEQDLEVEGLHGVRFETRREREGRPTVRKFVYYVDVAGEPFLVDMAAPAEAWAGDAPVFEAVLKTLRTGDAAG